jgi:hypothetical protein
MAEEYCWAKTEAAGQSRGGRSSYIAFVFRFLLGPPCARVLLEYTYPTLNSDLRKIRRASDLSGCNYCLRRGVSV